MSDKIKIYAVSELVLREIIKELIGYSALMRVNICSKEEYNKIIKDYLDFFSYNDIEDAVEDLIFAFTRIK